MLQILGLGNRIVGREKKEMRKARHHTMRHVGGNKKCSKVESGLGRPGAKRIREK